MIDWLMKMAFIEKNKFGFVDGSIQEPPANDHLFASWKFNNSIVVSCLFNSVTKEITTSVVYSFSAAAIWHTKWPMNFPI